MGEIDQARRLTAVQCGLEYILGHFKPPYFPRKVSTAATNDSQEPVNTIEKAMEYYNTSTYLDCRIQAFGVNETSPNLIFMDIDKKDFGGNMRRLKLGLTSTLKQIKQEIEGYPTVIWSGHGYHVLQPID